MNATGGQWRWTRTVLVFVAHALALAAALAVPIAALWGAIAALQGPGAERLSELVNARRWLFLLGNTAAITAVAIAIAWIVGGVLALLATRTDLPGRGLLLALIVLIGCVPLHTSLVFVFAAVPLAYLTGSVLACGVLYGLAYTPLAVLILAVTFRAADRELEDLALLDAGFTRVIRRVTLRLAAGGFLAVATLIVLLVGTDPAISDLLAVRTFAEEIRSQYALHGPRAGPLLTALPLLVVLGVLLVSVQTRYRLWSDDRHWDVAGAPRRLRLAYPMFFAIGVWLPAAGLMVILARALLVHVWPVEHAVRVARDLWPELWHSGVAAALGATAILLPAAGLAWALVRGGWLRKPVGAAVVVLLATPAPVVGITLVAALSHNDWRGLLRDSPLVVALTYYVRFLAVGVLLLAPAVRRIPQEVELAARLDGCDWWAEHWRIRWPAIAAPAAATWLVLAIFCYAEVAATVLVVPPAVQLASVRAFTLLHFGVYRDLAVLALLSSVAVLLPWTGLLLLGQRTWLETRAPRGR